MIPDHQNDHDGRDHLAAPDAPCAAWAPLLAAGARDIAPAQRAALAQHMATCAACAAAWTAYARMDRLIRGLPAPDPLPGLPSQLLAASRARAARQFGGLTGLAAWGRQSDQIEEMVLDGTSVSDEVNEGMRMMRTTSTDASTPTARQNAPRPRRRLTAWLGGTAAVAVVLLFALAFALLAHGASGPAAGHATGTGTAPARATATMLPSGMRAAYLAADGHLHYIALDSTHDVTGPALPDTAWIAQSGNDDGARAAVAPDGSAIAYAGGNAQYSTEVVIVKLATGAVTRIPMPATGGQSLVRAANLFWSPDGSQLAIDPYIGGNTGPISLIDVAHGTARQLNMPQVDRIVGWLDATHLAVIANRSPSASTVPAQASARTSGQVLAMPANGGPSLAVDALDIASGSLRHIVDVDSPPDVFVSPDGKLLYVAPSTWVGTGYVVDPATGQTRDLPTISGIFANRFTNISNDGFAQGGNWAVPMAWDPGTHTVAMSLGAWGPGTEGGPAVAVQTAGVWLLDLDHDKAVLVAPNAYPLAWMTEAALLVSSVPPSSAGFSAQNGGLTAGPVVSLRSPVAGGGQKVLVRNLVLFLGLVPAA